MIISKNSTFWDYNLKFHRLINRHSKYNNMHKNRMSYALICIYNIIIYIDYMLSAINSIISGVISG